LKKLKLNDILITEEGLSPPQKRRGPTAFF